MNRIHKLCLIVLLFAGTYCHAQSYGLQFAGNEVTQDSRTGLDLGSGSPICLEKNFSLSFELSFLPGQREYFGYIVRLIDSENHNVDIVYDTSTPIKRQIMVITGNHASDFPDPIEKSLPFSRWTKFVLRYAHDSKMLTVIIGNNHYQQRVNLSSTCLRILFGANSYKDFNTIDVPSMKVRDIKITENEKLSYHWPLNDRANNKAIEVQAGKDATVINPKWLRRAHSEWSELIKFDAKGRASVAFNPDRDEVYIVGTNLFYTFSINSKTLTADSYSSGPSILMKGNQSYYAKEGHQLYNLYIDQDVVSAYDWSKRSWDKKPTLPDSSTNFWHFNKLWSPTEKAFYTFNGYGHFKYKNIIRRFDVTTGKTQTLKPSGDYFAPRYLAGLGPVKDGAYLIGGYGSVSGEQIASPKNFYDLFYYSIKNNSLRKVYQLKETQDDFVFSNSLVIDEPSHSYYGLIFQKHKYNSHLQLVKGSLIKPEIEKLGNQVPFTFYDNNTFSDLFYSDRAKTFVAVTLRVNTNQVSEVSIYSLASPPLPAEIIISNQATKSWTWWYLWAITLLVVTIIIFLRLWYIKTRSYKVIRQAQPDFAQANKPTLRSTTLDLEHQSAAEDQQLFEPAAFESDQYAQVGSIYLFGDFEVFDSENVDITKHFTPLIKELFLVILIYTIKWKRGISSDELTELLWFDKSSESARNNRSVNIAKLKIILDRMQFCQVSKETGNWRVNIDHQKIKVDYYDYLNIIRSKSMLNKENLRALTEIIKKGSFLKKLDYEWLDNFKSEISHEVIDAYLLFAKSAVISEDPEFLIKIAGYIFHFDPVNEEAMILKCKALAYLGKHSLAKAAFENFGKEYKSIYGKDFPHDFHSILEQAFPPIETSGN